MVDVIFYLVLIVVLVVYASGLGEKLLSRIRNK